MLLQLTSNIAEQFKHMEIRGNYFGLHVTYSIWKICILSVILNVWRHIQRAQTVVEANKPGA